MQFDITQLSYPLDAEQARLLVAQSNLLQAHPSENVPDSSAIDEQLLQGAVVVMGAFDGLHLGHRALVKAALADAHARRLPCVVVTFDPDPSELLQPGAPQPELLSISDRLLGLSTLGVDRCIALPFTHELAALSPKAFVCDRLMGLLKPVSVHVGSNFRFGYRGEGTVETLAELGGQFGFEVVCDELVDYDGERVSSTRIRGQLALPAGLPEANAMLARCHFVRGNIEHGRGEGTSFGFPTANVRCAPHSCMPCQGVYAGFVSVGGTAWPAAINVGAPPSFSSPDELFLEANLIGFSGDIYGADAVVTFVEWLRPSRVFESLDELERVVLGNIDWVRVNLGSNGVRLS